MANCMVLFALFLEDCIYCNRKQKKTMLRVPPFAQEKESYTGLERHKV